MHVNACMQACDAGGGDCTAVRFSLAWQSDDYLRRQLQRGGGGGSAGTTWVGAAADAVAARGAGGKFMQAGMAGWRFDHLLKGKQASSRDLHACKQASRDLTARGLLTCSTTGKQADEDFTKVCGRKLHPPSFLSRRCR